ncbi:methionine ABC transporter substrate-binding protein [Sediminibacillus dalangtanensis]|uniref:Lipoprotein n=1 Tax=Sediminibacillus dalangtanensis TaxID=2729421 RepID=A0ABX7VTD1_9BACI|nr:MetQ/NlpA family ABC transporter substrate-binding protein [Sediminibacillus dalangtanensis]QTN00220.1 methionine ABC transporter substrate-binding protein [Sediminibacillus dalangtanensis]
MKKYLFLLLTAAILAVLAACGSSDEGESGESTSGEGSETAEIKVGASSTPHAEILEQAKPLLEEQGVTLTIEEYQDYVLPNQDLEDGEIDANYFQHKPYLQDQINEFGYDFVSLGGVHVEPMGVYSKNISSIDEIPEGTEVIISRSVADHGRILSLFEANGLIKLDESVDKVSATTDDIVENPKNLTFSPDVDAATLPEMYESEEDTLVAINTNYALEAGLVPTEDAIFMEGEESPYVNQVVVRSEDKDNEALNKLVEVLQSEEIQNFISENYDGAIVPAATPAD